MSILACKRALYDQYSFELFNQLLKKLSVPYDAVYVWANYFDIVCRQKYTNPNVILAIKDNIYDYQQKMLSELFEKHLDKKFVLLTSLENLNLFGVEIIPWGGDIVNQHDLYRSTSAVLEKDFSSTKHVVSFNRSLRPHRVILLSLMFYYGIEQHANISMLNLPTCSTLSQQILDFNNNGFPSVTNTDLLNILEQGYQQLVNNNTLVIDDASIYRFGNRIKENDTYGNFELRLKPRYQYSFVELVSENGCQFHRREFNLTEKTLQSFYGCNFPILIANPGTVAFLKHMGFDMFDDVVNHDYDLEIDPFRRIHRAIIDNQQLLTDGALAKQQWLNCRHRFENNVNRARSIYDWYSTRTLTLFDQIVWQHS